MGITKLVPLRFWETGLLFCQVGRDFCKKILHGTDYKSAPGGKQYMINRRRKPVAN